MISHKVKFWIYESIDNVCMCVVHACTQNVLGAKPSGCKRKTLSLHISYTALGDYPTDGESTSDGE